MKKGLLIGLIVLTLFMTACSGDEEYVIKNMVDFELQVKEWDEPEVEEEIVDLGPRSLLTGLPMDEEYIYRRPFAVVLGNNRAAWPHSGISYADVIYEAVAEGGVTRLIAFFHSELPTQVGPVRSAREHFIDFAINHDAVFVHHTSSQGAMNRLLYYGINRIDGGSLGGNIFWRDASRPDWAGGGTRATEHSSYMSPVAGLEHMENISMRSEIEEPESLSFNFGAIPADVSPLQRGTNISIAYSPVYRRTFNFDAETGLYFVGNSDGAHLDALNQEQVSVTNVLIQSTWIRGTGAGDLPLFVNTGRVQGYLITGGEVFVVYWVRDWFGQPIRWYFENGEPMVLPLGRTWVNSVTPELPVHFNY